jgi:glycosyltransferase involved in cell wall biosynthesis
MKILTSGHKTDNHHEVREFILNSVVDRIDLKKKDLPHFVVIDAILPRDRMLDLYATCDLYISTDRANGWGMSFMEVMAMGKPAATINYSGSTEFMKRENSLLIETTGRLVPVDPRFVEQAPLFAGHQWGEVHVEEVQRVMRYAYEHPNELKQIAERGMKDIRENYSLEAVAKKVVAALSEIPPISKQHIGRSKFRFKKAYGLKFRLRLLYHRLKYWYTSKTKK